MVGTVCGFIMSDSASSDLSISVNVVSEHKYLAALHLYQECIRDAYIAGMLGSIIVLGTKSRLLPNNNELFSL